jgi:hypothetical protein
MVQSTSGSKAVRLTSHHISFLISKMLHAYEGTRHARYTTDTSSVQRTHKLDRKASSLHAATGSLQSASARAQNRKHLAVSEMNQFLTACLALTLYNPSLKLLWLEWQYSRIAHSNGAPRPALRSSCWRECSFVSETEQRLLTS